MNTATHYHLGDYDNGSVQTCSECGTLLINPGYHKQSVIHCGRSQRWYEYDYRDIAAIRGNDGRWRIWMLDVTGEALDHEFTHFNHGRGYASLRGAKDAWARCN